MGHREIPNNIRMYCDLRGYTVKEFERAMGIANGAVKKWEDGKVIPSLRTLEKIAEETGVPVGMWLSKGAFEHADSKEHRRSDVRKEAQSA